MRLAEIQRVLNDVFRGATEVGDAARILGVPAARLAIYRDFVEGHMRSILAKNYIYLRRLIAPETWDELAHDYYLAHPSQHWELNQAARGFDEFLAAQLANGRPGLAPFHCVLASFEWEELATYLQETEVPPPGDARVPNPTLSVLQLPFDVPGFIDTYGVDGMTPETALPEPLAEPLACFMYRDPADLYSRWEVVTPELAFALKVVSDGLSDEAAAEASGQSPARVRELVADAAERGIVIVPT